MTSFQLDALSLPLFTVISQLAKFLSKGPDGECFRLPGPYKLCHSYSALPLWYKSQYRKGINLWAWPCSSKYYWWKLKSESHIIFTCYKISFFFWFFSAVQKYKNFKYILIGRLYWSQAWFGLWTIISPPLPYAHQPLSSQINNKSCKSFPGRW